jgi:hypothetical protein
MSVSAVTDLISSPSIFVSLAVIYQALEENGSEGTSG